MKNFNVYQHSVKGYEAVKDGFSWPAFFFTWIWAFAKGLVRQGAVLLFAVFIVNVLTRVGDPLIVILGGLAALVICIFAGINGNECRENSLTDRGYKWVKKVQAGSADAATSQFGSGADVQAKIDAAVAKALEEKEAEAKRGETPKAA